MNILCKIFGHDYREGWAGSYGGPFGAVVVNIKTCNRCDHTEKEFSTHVPQLEVTR
jgi:hypothetical protein